MRASVEKPPACPWCPRRYRMAYAVMDGKIYVFGGLSQWDDREADHSDPKSTMIYDMASVRTNPMMAALLSLPSGPGSLAGLGGWGLSQI